MKKILTPVFCLFLALGSTFGQDRPIHEVYSMMVFNFTKYVQWPTHSGEFVIGVIGNADIHKTLEQWYGGQVRNGKTYIIKKFNSAAEMTDCNVVFIDKSKSGEFDVVKTKISGKGTLLITDKNGLGQKGSAINFKNEGEKLKFELNQKAMESANLKVSSSLVSMAILI